MRFLQYLTRKALILPAIWINNYGIGCYSEKEIISGMDCMLIPIKWVPASYILKFLPFHLMAFSFSLNSIPFFTCCCMISHAAAIAAYLSYFATTVILNCASYLMSTLLSLWERKWQNNMKFFVPFYAWILQSCICTYFYAKNWYILSDQLKQSTKQKNIFHF